MYSILKYVHVGAAVITATGFILRGYWMLVESAHLQRLWVRVAPHVIDTVFLLSGVALIAILRLPVLNQPWLLTKFVALVVYILLGSVALKRGPTKRVRSVAFVLALMTFLYIVGVALNKSVISWAAWF